MVIQMVAVHGCAPTPRLSQGSYIQVARKLDRGLSDSVEDDLTGCSLERQYS
jgi:hypothetical protein